MRVENFIKNYALLKTVNVSHLPQAHILQQWWKKVFESIANKYDLINLQWHKLMDKKKLISKCCNHCNEGIEMANVFYITQCLNKNPMS